MNTTNRLLSRIFKGEIPNDILCCINHSLISSFSKEIKAYRNGEKSLRNYQRTQPLPFKGRSIKQLNPEGYEYTFTLFKIPFRTYLGKDRDKRKLLAEMFHGKVKLCISNIVLEEGKIFLLAAFEIAKEQQQLDESVIAEASLSIDYPIALSIDKRQYLIGNKEEFLHRRLAIQSARLRVRKGATFNRGGHGRKRKTKSCEHYSDKEKNYVEHKLHVYSKRLVDICLKNRAATLVLVNQQAKEEIAKENEFLLQNWSYYGLVGKIKYKADRVGIMVVTE